MDRGPLIQALRHMPIDTDDIWQWRGEPSESDPREPGLYMGTDNANRVISLLEATLDVQYARRADLVALHGHVLTAKGPLVYPGGKNGMYQVHCLCGYVSPPGGHSTARIMWEAARQHKAAKEAAA